MRKVKVIWVNDKDSLQEAENKSNQMKGKLDMKWKRPGEELNKFLKDIKRKEELRPDLFLVDYLLNREPIKGSERSDELGFEVAGKIRDQFPDIPIYGLSAVEDPTYFAYRKRYFDRTLHLEEDFEERGGEILLYDGLDFRNIRNQVGKGKASIRLLLKVPQSSRDYLEKVIPSNFNDGLYSSSNNRGRGANPIDFARWVMNTLLQNPGPLFDELYTATHLGIKEKVFHKYVKIFEKARYSGVFSKSHDARWWSSELDNIIFEKRGKRKFETVVLRKLAPELLGIKPKEYAICAKCKKKFPETIGVPKNDTDFLPVHISCSIQHPNIKRDIYYEELRQFSYDR